MTPEELEQIAETEREAQSRYSPSGECLRCRRMPFLPEPGGKGRSR